MNVLDAISTGRPFKRKGETEWREGANGDAFITYHSLLADDWEVMPISVTITDQQFWEAAKESMDVTTPSIVSDHARRLLSDLAKRLGIVAEDK